MTGYCQFIPKSILNKLPKKDNQKELDDFFRNTRKTFLEQPAKREAVLKRMRTTHKETRRLFDSKNSYSYTNKPIAVDVQTHSSAPSNYPALELANKIYDFLHDDFDLHSFDNKETPIDVHINFGNGYNNAFYDGIRFTFGNGDGYYFNNFLLQNIFTHELVHGITDHKSGLKYEMEMGALNEHLSDTFAVCLDQKLLNQQKATDATWLIGEGLWTSRVKGKALRSFKNEMAFNDPEIGYDDQPKFMKDYQKLPNTEDGDYGGVHTNSGILNHAFYNFCVLAEKEVGDETATRSWHAPLNVWYNTYPRIKPNTKFREFALDTIAVTKLKQPQLQKQIKDAWSIVEVV